VAKKGDVNKQKVLMSKHARRLPRVYALKSKIESVWYNVLSVDAIKMACNSFKNSLSKVVAKRIPTGDPH